MTIHLLDSNDKPPEPGNTIVSNCGDELILDKITPAEFDDSRVCQKCLAEHRQTKGKMFTFGFIAQA